MNSLKKGEGVLLLNFEGDPGVPLLNFEEGCFRVPRSNVPRSWSDFYTMPIRNMLHNPDLLWVVYSLCSERKSLCDGLEQKMAARK